ncbi:MAG: esterase-like activity of phytase family protein, partial [Methylococcus sp.]
TGRREGRSNRSSIKPLRKSLLIDLDQAGWTAEKAEGLALVDDHTLALTNDNDFGLTSVLVDKAGQTLDGKVEKCRLNPNRQLSGDQCPKGAASVAITALPATAARQQFWLLRFARPLRDD